mgnify:CR=1 FL=1
MKSISIVIPAYNEEKRIGKTLECYCKFFDNKLKNNYQILIVINGTTDDTEKIVKNYQKYYKSIKYIILKEAGKGLAVNTGLKESLTSRFDLIGFVDADLATSPLEYYKLIENIDNYDGIIADRYIKGAKITPKFSFRRLVVSRIFNIIVRSLFFLPYKDTQCGAKIFKKEVIKSVINELTMTQWAYDIDLLYSCKKYGLHIKSLPTNWIEAKGSTLNLKKASIQMFFSIIQLRIAKSKFNKLIKLFEPIIRMIYKAVK